MNGLEKFSTTHLENCQKIVDEMALNIATFLGCFEALRLLYPGIMNSEEMHDLYDIVHRRLMVINQQPLSIFLAQYSQFLQEEIEKRKGS